MRGIPLFDTSVTGPTAFGPERPQRSMKPCFSSRSALSTTRAVGGRMRRDSSTRQWRLRGRPAIGSASRISTSSLRAPLKARFPLRREIFSLRRGSKLMNKLLNAFRIVATILKALSNLFISLDPLLKLKISLRSGNLAFSGARNEEVEIRLADPIAGLPRNRHCLVEESLRILPPTALVVDSADREEKQGFILLCGLSGPKAVGPVTGGAKGGDRPHTTPI